MMIHTIVITEEERQMMLLALAKLALERPGWNDTLNELALKMDNKDADGRAQMFDNFKQHNFRPPT